MVCIFCIAVFALIAGSLTAAHLDSVEGSLRTRAVDADVRRTVDSESVTKFELTVAVGDRAAPVAITVFKAHKRVRIQVLTHDLERAEVEALEDDLADAIGAEIIDRSDPTHEASAQHAAEHAAEDALQAAETEQTERTAAPPVPPATR